MVSRQQKRPLEADPWTTGAGRHAEIGAAMLLLGARLTLMPTPGSVPSIPVDAREGDFG